MISSISLLFKRNSIAFNNSVKLCGGIFVAIPTAIPITQFISKLGILVGRTVGSCFVVSKLSLKSTVSFSMSASINSANLVILASVYLYAAALSQSIEPKLPCPCTKGYLSEKSWAILTIAS